MRKIQLSGKDLHFSEADLPMLIHGEDSSGASLYTISVAADLHAQGKKILFLCGYPMAEKEFLAQTGHFGENAKFFTKERVVEFKECLATADDTIVFLKNTELFDEDVIELFLHRQSVVLSGDMHRTCSSDAIFSKPFATKIAFSKIDHKIPLVLKKYEAFFSATDREGITKLS